MGRPKGTQQELEARRKEAREMHRNGATFAQIAATLDCTVTAVGQWIHGPARPPFPVEQLRVRVFARLQEPRSAAVATGGRYTAWTTDALPFAFGEAFLNDFVDDETEALTPDIYTNTLQDWDCYQDEHGVWRTPPSA